MALDLESLARSEAAFDYQSRYLQCQLIKNGPDSLNTRTSAWQMQMWIDHAHKFRAPWSGLICP